MTISEIRPCPICGSSASLIYKERRGWFVKCDNVFCVIQRYGSIAAGDAVANWNGENEYVIKK